MDLLDLDVWLKPILDGRNSNATRNRRPLDWTPRLFCGNNALIERRDKIGRAFFAQVLPLDKFAVAGDKLQFEDLEVVYKFRAARSILKAWSVFDNETEQKKALPFSDAIPAGAVSIGAYLACDLTSADPKDAGKSVTVYLRKLSSRLKIVGIDRKW